MADSYWNDQGLDPIVTDHAPGGQDYAGFGTIWVDQTADDIYIATNTVNGLMVWTPCGGGTGSFSSLTVTGGDANITGGDLIVTGGDFYVSAGAIRFGAFGKGLLFSSATGVITSSAGANGQIVIGKTGDSPLWADITAGPGILITPGANTLTIEATGATAVSYITDVAGPVVPDGTGAVTIVGGSNLTTDGTVANTITIDLDSTISVTGKITAGNDFEMTAGTALIASDDNSAQAIYLHANGGVNETIDIYSQLGTTATSLNFHSAVGGITVDSGLAAATAIHLHASNAAGGIDFTAGTAGIALTAANGPVALVSGTGAMNIGTDATVHTLTLGSTTGAAATVVQSGTGNLSLTSTGTVSAQTTGGFVNIATNPVAAAVSIGNSTGASSVIVDVGTGNLDLGVTATAHTVRIGSTTGASDLTAQTGTGAMTFTAGGIFDVNAVGAVTIDSTGGTLSIGSGADAFGINIGTGASARTVTIGNNSGATSVVLDCGTGAFDLGVTATDHTSRLGSTTGVSALTLQAGTGAMTFTAGGAFDVNAVGAVTIDSTGGALQIGAGANAFAVDIGTGAAARTITIGNNTTTTALQLTSGTGDITLTSADAVIADAVGVVEINSSGAAISIGNDANAFGINIGTGAAARTIEIGNNTGATAINLSAGSGEVNSDTDINLTTAGTGFVLQEGPKILAGAGSPNGVVTAPKGSLFLATNGSGVGDRAYINRDGATDWTAITTAS